MCQALGRETYGIGRIGHRDWWIDRSFLAELVELGQDDVTIWPRIWPRLRGRFELGRFWPILTNRAWPILVRIEAKCSKIGETLTRLRGHVRGADG
mgnify:CR=1 FL=1